MHEYVNAIEQAIQGMVDKASAMNRGDAPVEAACRKGWWVLAVGGHLDGESFEQREEARDALRRELSERSIRLSEYVWIWDATNRAQVVLRTFERRELAETFAAALEKRGVRVRLARQWDTLDER